jgi:hypothetical protein
VDKVNGKYVLLVGLASFAAGLALVARVARPGAHPAELLAPLALAGFGSGLTFAPLFSLGLRNVRPELTGVASGIVNTVQELGGLLAGAVIGVLLQARFASDLGAWARDRAASLPAGDRAGFLAQYQGYLDGTVNIATGAPTGSTGQAGGSLAQEALAAFHQAFARGIQTSLLVQAGVLVLGLVAACWLRASAAPGAETAPAPTPDEADISVG